MTRRAPLPRDALRADLPAISAIHAAGWRETHARHVPRAYLDGALGHDTRRLWRRVFAQMAPGRFVLLADGDGTARGFACVLPGRPATLAALYVVRPARRRGVARALLRETARRLGAQGTPGLALAVLADNEGARRFYTALGARETGSARATLPGGTQARVCRMAWTDVAAMADEHPSGAGLPARGGVPRCGRR